MVKRRVVCPWWANLIYEQVNIECLEVGEHLVCGACKVEFHKDKYVFKHGKAFNVLYKHDTTTL